MYEDMKIERVRADSLRFGDLLPYFGQHVRNSQPHGAGMVRVNFIRRIGADRHRVAFYPHESVFVVRAGSGR